MHTITGSWTEVVDEIRESLSSYSPAATRQLGGQIFRMGCPSNDRLSELKERVLRFFERTEGTVKRITSGQVHAFS